MHLSLVNMCVGAKHDRSKYEIISNSLYAVMLRPLQKPDAALRSLAVRVCKRYLVKVESIL
jgi:hypothetical protein